MTTRQLQELLKIDRITIYRMLEDGRLRGFKVGGQWRFQRREVERWLAQQRPPASASDPAGADPERFPGAATVLPLTCIQGLQNILAEASGGAAVTLSETAQPLTEVSGACRLCRLILSSQEGSSRCRASWRSRASCPEDAAPMPCHAGLHYLAGAIQVGGRTVATILLGQLVPGAMAGPALRERLAKLGWECGLNTEALIEAAIDLQAAYSEESLRRAARLLRISAETFSEMSRERAHILGRLQSIADLTILD